MVDFFDLMKKTVNAIFHHRSTETRIHCVNDKILIGLLNLSNRLLLIRPELQQVAIEQDFVMEIFEKCLFDLQDFDQIESNFNIYEYDQIKNKCKGNDSRAVAYRLLFAICKGNSKSMRQLINKGLIPLIQKLPSPNSSSNSSYRSVF